jgi:hypothetical protein
MSEAVKAQAIVAAIKEVIAHKITQIEAEVDKFRKTRAEEHLKTAQADLVAAEAALAVEVAKIPATVVGLPTKV